jgi:ubiquinone/menaquinone biosynthesis C-methylase UbiE
MSAERALIKGELSGFYDRIARDYHQVHYLATTSYSPLKQRQRYIEEMIDELHLPPGARILDVGCGPGELVLHLLQQGYQATGIDISDGMVSEAAATIRASGFPNFAAVSVGDIEKLAFEDGAFDVVIASGVIEYQKDDREALLEMRRVLTRNGHVILNVTNRYSYITLSENLYKRMKKVRFIRRALVVLRRWIGQEGQLTEIPNNRTHAPRQFDRDLRKYDFQKVSHNFFRFSPLPVPLDSLLPSTCRAIGRWMERFSRRPLGILGGGYLVMARKER